MRWFWNAFGGTMGVIFGLGMAACLSIGGCMFLCAGFNGVANRTFGPATVERDAAPQRQTPPPRVSQEQSVSPQPIVAHELSDEDAATPVTPEPRTPTHRSRQVGAIQSIMDATEPKSETPVPSDEERAEANEKRATQKFALAKQLLNSGKTDGGRRHLREIIEKHPNTSAATEAKSLLGK